MKHIVSDKEPLITTTDRKVNDRSSVSNITINGNDKSSVIQNKTTKSSSEKTINNVKENKIRPENKIIKGTRVVDGDQQMFAGVKQRIWLHIGRVELNTTEDNINKHLIQLFTGRSFVVEALKSREGASSISHKIGGDLVLMEVLYDSKNWPSGVTDRRFRFFREKRVSNGVFAQK